MDHFNTFSLCPIGRLFQMERIRVLNVFPFCAKLQSHTQPVKERLAKEIGSSATPHLTSPLPFHGFSTHDPIV